MVIEIQAGIIDQSAYKVWADNDGKITHVQRNGRFIAQTISQMEGHAEDKLQQYVDYLRLTDLSRSTIMNNEDRDKLHTLQNLFANSGLGNPPPKGHDSWEEYGIANR